MFKFFVKEFLVIWTKNIGSLIVVMSKILTPIWIKTGMIITVESVTFGAIIGGTIAAMTKV